jgi:flavin-binding protein dodecin
MTTIKAKDYTGFSESSIAEAMDNALEKSGKQCPVEVIETRSSQQGQKPCEYHVTLTVLES